MGIKPSRAATPNASMGSELSSAPRLCSDRTTAKGRSLQRYPCSAGGSATIAGGAAGWQAPRRRQGPRCDRAAELRAGHNLPPPRESDRAKPAHGGVKTKNFAQIVLIYAGLERSELASASAKQKQLIAAVFDALLPSRPWFCPRKPRALPPVSGEAGCSVAADDLRHGCLAPICSAMSPLFLARPLPLHFPLL